MILILTRFTDDCTVQKMRRLLEAQGVDLVIVAQSTLEAPSSFSIQGGSPRGADAVLRLHDRVLRLDEIQAAWLWRSWRPDKHEPRFHDLARRQAEWRFFENEWASFHHGVALALAYSGVFCVNPPPLNAAFEEKCCQLLLAAEVGLSIPPTLYTTRLGAARAFSAAHDGDIIYKPFTPYVRLLPAEGELPSRIATLYTNRVRPADLVEEEGFLPTPSIFQPYIEKQLELRVVVVGRRLFACAIHSQQSARSREDWRRYDLDHTPYEPYALPAEIAQKILQFMDRLGLVFGSIDMILTPEGEYVFLEINPNGQFDWIAERTGLPIYEHLAAMLRAGRVDYPGDAVMVAERAAVPHGA